MGNFWQLHLPRLHFLSQRVQARRQISGKILLSLELPFQEGSTRVLSIPASITPSLAL